MLYIYFIYIINRLKNFTQRSAVLCRVGGAVQYSKLQCTANHQFAIQWSSISTANLIAVHWNYKYIFLTVKWSALYRKEVQCTSMDKNVVLCSALEFITAHPRLTKSPLEEETFLNVFFCIGASISIGREIRCLPYAGFFWKSLYLVLVYWLEFSWTALNCCSLHCFYSENCLGVTQKLAHWSKDLVSPVCRIFTECDIQYTLIWLSVLP